MEKPIKKVKSPKESLPDRSDYTLSEKDRTPREKRLSKNLMFEYEAVKRKCCRRVILIYQELSAGNADRKSLVSMVCEWLKNLFWYLVQFIKRMYWFL